MQWIWRVGFLFVVWGCTDLGSESETRDTLKVGTYNAGLAYGFVPHAEQRAPEIFAALPEIDVDVLCVQEFWEAGDWNALNSAASASNVWGNSYRRPPKPEPDPPLMMDASVMDASADGSAGGDNVRCTSEEANPLEICARDKCGDVSVDGLVACVVDSCPDAVAGLGTPCFECVVGAIGNDLDTILNRCGPEGMGGSDGGFAYEGSFGTGILSNMPLRDTEALVLRSTTNRRAVLYAKLAGTAAGTVHFFCTHLTANLTQLPYTGDYESWADEQAAQVETMLDWVDDKAGTDGKVILAGDFNSGPSIGDIRASLPENYALYAEAGYDNVYASRPDAQCTSCDANPIGDDLAVATGSLIDHVFSRNLSNETYELSAERFLTEPLTVEIDGESTESAYSDHYGVRLGLQRR